ncbi:glycosyltransferase [Flavobacterium sp.]|uniref:glycosyltransferase n=1 Tax=Flavobacterium sp. TaxID=239 RepID=UPI002CEF9EBB|nr:glycosyltransferase [Flavobacterium sp.]HSD06337.1 glycosyltransferase [Flavobacterium sp.]
MKSIHLYSTPKDFKIGSNNILDLQKKDTKLPQILFLTTFPPRECGIATYSEDLILALNNKYKKSFDIKIAALELQNEKHTYNEDIYTVLETDNPDSYVQLAENVNKNKAIEIVLIQHEFGLFRGNEDDFLSFLRAINKPIIVVCHTVLPRPDENLKKHVQDINKIADAFIVMTKNSAKLLKDDYKVLKNKISVIPHGTHLVEHSNKEVLKEKYNLLGRKVISTFGLLGSGKSIETTLDALPTIIKEQPSVMFMIIGKTHPGIVKHEGEKYRDFLKEKIKELHLENNVRFVDQYLKLDALLEYLQLTDIYLFTSKDRNQAVSGTFSYALSCGCPIISTPIPHAIEVLKNKTGYIVEFENPQQLAEKVILLLGNEKLRRKIGLNGLHKIAPTAWENSAIAHANLFEKTAIRKMPLYYKIPEVNFNHFKNMTTDFAMIQFSKINQPDLATGYTLDDNARALVAMCQHYKLNKNKSDLEYIRKYFEFIKFCFQPNGKFLNYVDKNKKFTEQNSENLEDANGRGIWALGFLISKSDILPADLREDAILLMQNALANVRYINSTRAMAFIIKGIYYSNLKNKSAENTALLVHFADKLVQMYKHEASEDWQWFEGYLTYANSTLPEAMLCAYVSTGNRTYKEIAHTTFDFLLSKIYKNGRVKVISNKGWLNRGEEIDDKKVGGEQPIDVAYTILALSKFYNVFKEPQYYKKMQIAFDWFLGNNHLNEIIYNPCTGGCYDGLEETSVNLNQGAESTVSYLMARLTIEKHLRQKAKARKESQPAIISRKSKVVVPLNINTPYPSQIRA